MKALDLFCCQGGTSRGYMDSGLFESVVGVDINPQPRYPYEFIQGDAMELMADEDFMSQFDFVHASPPCQGYSVTKGLSKTKHPELVPQTRELLVNSGLQWVIENVPGSPMKDCLTLCGSMFGLKVIRHRWFETSRGFLFPPFTCSCSSMTTGGNRYSISSFENGATAISVAGHGFKVDDAKIALDIDWMSGYGLSQAIPPAYTQYIAEIMFIVEEREQKEVTK